MRMRMETCLVWPVPASPETQTKCKHQSKAVLSASVLYPWSAILLRWDSQTATRQKQRSHISNWEPINPSRERAHSNFAIVQKCLRKLRKLGNAFPLDSGTSNCSLLGLAFVRRRQLPVFCHLPFSNPEMLWRIRAFSVWVLLDECGPLILVLLQWNPND